MQLWDNLGCQKKIENPRGFLLRAEKKGKDGLRYPNKVGSLVLLEYYNFKLAFLKNGQNTKTGTG